MSTDSSDVQGKREQTKARNRAVILDAARAVFVEIGYDAATVRDIVARTDLAPGTFYNYFPDKQSVLIALTNEAAAQGSRRIRAARAEASSLTELAYRGYRAYFEFIAQDRVMFELMRRNASTLRTLGLDATGFAAGVEELREDLERELKKSNLPLIGMAYVPQIIAAMATFGVFLMLWVIDWMGTFMGPNGQAVFQYLSITGHFEDFTRGVLDTKHLVYYTSFILFGLFLTMRSVETERWRG